MIGGTVGYGALPGGIELELDLSDLRQALADLRERTGLRSRTGLGGLGLGLGGSLGGGLRCLTGRREPTRIPWARRAEHAGPLDADSTPTAALPLPTLPPAGTQAGPVLPAQPGVEPPPGGPDTPGAQGEPHRADPRPGRPSSRALRNPAQRRPVDSETGGTVVVGRPPGGAGSGGPPGQEPPGHDGPDRDDQPGYRVPGPTRGRRSAERPAPETHDEDEDVWDLVRQAQAGDASAFARIYDRYFDTVYRYISYRIGSRTVAEDLTSEVWLRALRRIGSVTWQGRDLGAWLVTIARNLIADHYKSARARLEVTTADMLDADDEAPGPEGRPEAEVITRLDNATLLDAVRRLNPEQQECITLRFLQGLSVTETAQIMGKNDGAIKALQYRAVRTLGRLLPEGFTP
ncbi:ECF subfamily RNA polymerase sigma factor, BldN family [Cryptosporangium aurantiacum]|uniref:RNA polymerase sigma-70 factor, TIGR02952 family n=1 Tax=Cryptosporangium aurantiacum TaxID=134849 RepID=A0A1M7RH95_9ACTN|nr:ECF subfamily RNA polymerase sigma factor, BldN family [Cryptosporangium aurantiacum]SHN45627.1 RNA polymerase sigma-70 factor, TIGR02952 family [Cryptosporangium aurantiacum]